MAEWEVEEFYCDKTLLPDEYADHTPRCGDGSDPNVIEVWGLGLEYLYFQDKLDALSRKSIQKAKYTGEADSPTVGWEYLRNDDGSFGTFAFRTYLDWGYCIWDKSRVEDWRLIDELLDTVDAMKERWDEISGCPCIELRYRKSRAADFE